MTDLDLIGIGIGLQGVCLLFDEFVFHWRRDLPPWERIGHPIDSLSFLAALSIPVLWRSTEGVATVGYAALAVISCLCVTKDEGVHLKHASPQEQHLHGLMFLLHSAILVFVWMAWRGGEFQLSPLLLLPVSIFTLYQIIYWNFVRPPYVAS